ncbi:MAG: PQQ-binding-like beta-propeller repeat protein [Anaerolineae bacterium]|nr:MAG: PQQ-binding-like beta-propeller repeat protein [Anaerolineae bacterium]
MDAVAGTQKWQFTASAALMSTPVMVGDRLYLVGMDNKVYALNAENGSKIWEYSVTQE